MGNFNKPRQVDVENRSSFSKYVLDAVKSPLGRRNTSGSLTGTPQYALTSFSQSDILQGTFSVKNPNDTLLVINKALTQDLAGLYSFGADSLSSFSSVPPSSVLVNGAKAANAAGLNPQAQNAVAAGLASDGVTVDKAWVASLPLEHPTNKALIWVRQGKASREMHLGTQGENPGAGTGHKQYDFPDPKWAWPWNMDRAASYGQPFDVKPVKGEDGYVKFWEGGETILGTKTDGTDPRNTTIGNENPALKGPGGAFGELTPEEEQFYCSMAWPYNSNDNKSEFAKAGRQDVIDKAVANNLKSSSYKGKRVLVYSVRTQKAVVCTPGDWGPLPKWSTGAVELGSIKGFYMGCSPDVHYALGTDHGDEMMFGWVDDATPLGPYTKGSGVTTMPISAGGANVTGSPAAVGGGGQNTIDELIAAGVKIANHPNCWMSRKQNFIDLVTKGQKGGGDPKQVFYHRDGSYFLIPALLNYFWYIFEGGFILSDYGNSIRNTKTESGRPSFHNHGGAIDIFGIGLASEQRIYGYTNQKWRPISDQLFSYMATLPKSTWPRETASSFAMDYANGYHVYKDPNPSHLHLGFSREQGGRLISALLG